MKTFQEYLSENSIRGEYWIQDGSVHFADGDVGDYNHEGMAIEEVFGKFQDEIISLAEDLDIEVKERGWGHIDTEGLSNAIYSIENELEERGTKNADAYIMQKLNADPAAYQILKGGGDAKGYVMVNEGWIAVRGENVELYGWDENKRKSLASGLGDILHQEGIEETEEMMFSIYDDKTKKSFEMTLEQIENPNQFRPQTTITTKGDNRFTKPEEDRLMPKIPPKAPLQKPIPGQDLWRGTSESFSFKEWLSYCQS